jgi:hypothetical protein
MNGLILSDELLYKSFLEVFTYNLGMVGSSNT